MTQAVIEERTKVQAIEDKINRFITEVNAEEVLEVDGILDKGEFHKGIPVEQDSIKVLHHLQKRAYLVPVTTILDTKLDTLVEALQTTVFNKLYGVTRIVGYYSRTSNWNKSKVGELKDRHKGNYSVKACDNIAATK